MSPFASALRQIRLRYDLRQADLARMISYEQSYVSGVELGSKGPPTHEFVSKLIEVLELPAAEAEFLRQARQVSERKFEIRTDAPEETYLLCNMLHIRVGQLHPLQRQAILNILQLPDDLKAAPALPEKTKKSPYFPDLLRKESAM